MYWDEKVECMSRDELAALQLARLQDAVRRNYEHVAAYRKAMEEKGIVPQDIKTLDDVKNLPFTTKQDLRDSYPYGRVAVPMTEIIRTHASSGTTGKPTVVCYTKKDIDTWADLIARALTMAGGTKGDVLQVGYGYGLFTGGLVCSTAAKGWALGDPGFRRQYQKQLTLMTDGAAQCWLVRLPMLVFGGSHGGNGYDRQGYSFKSSDFRSRTLVQCHAPGNRTGLESESA